MSKSNEVKFEAAQVGLLEILYMLLNEGSYDDYQHLLDTLVESGLTAEEILSGGKS